MMSIVYGRIFVYFFFFKQKTAYEMRISDWSSDVCSSDLSMEGFYAPAEAAKPSAPKLLIFNHALAERIGIEVADVADDDLARIFSGEEMPEGADPLALAYAGPQ